MGLSDVYFVRDTAVALSEDGLEDGLEDGARRERLHQRAG